MKRKLLQLAAAFLLTATLILSCSKGESELCPPDRSASAQIAPPEPDGTKVTTEDGTRLTITGWAAGDKVTLVKVVGTSDVITSEFTCVDAAAGLFSGPLPDGVASVSEFSIAVHNGGNFKNQGGELLFSTKYRISEKVEDMIVMYAIKDGSGKYTMKIANNILKITNNSGAPVTSALKASIGAMCVYIVPMFSADESNIYSSGGGNVGSFANASFVIPTGVSYVCLPSSEGSYKGHKFGLCKSSDSLSGASVASLRSIPTRGNIFNLTI